VVNEIKANKFQKAVKEIASELKVDPDTLLSTITSEKVDNLDTVKLIAKAMPKIQKEAPKVDSGKSMGGSKPTYTAEQINDRAFWEAHRADILLASKEGRIK